VVASEILGQDAGERGDAGVLLLRVLGDPGMLQDWLPIR
jgi:hypothetical protein